MEQYWTASDIKDKFTSLIVKIGDEFVCMSTVRPNTRNYFRITGMRSDQFYFTLQYREDIQTGKIMNMDVLNVHCNKETILNKVRQGLYRKL